MKQNKQNSKIIKKRAWTEEEDHKVMQLVEELGPQKWTYISSQIEGRIGKQCRERWHNHLNPLIKKSAWNNNEEWLLFLYHKAISNKWAEIAKHIEGRTDNSIKNHWNSGMKKRIPEFQFKFQQIKQKFIAQGQDVIEQLPQLEKKALEIILLNKEYQSMLTDSSESSESPTKLPKKNRMHKQYLTFKRQQQQEQEQFSIQLKEEQEIEEFSNSLQYFYTPAAFQKKRAKLLSGNKNYDFEQDDLRQNLFP